MPFWALYSWWPLWLSLSSLQSVFLLLLPLPFGVLETKSKRQLSDSATPSPTSTQLYPGDSKSLL